MNNCVQKGDNCIIAVLLKYDKVVKELRRELGNVQGWTSEMGGNVEDVNAEIKREYERLVEEVKMKVCEIENYAQERKRELDSVTKEYKQEIEGLIKENKEIVEMIEVLERRIGKMQRNIGMN